MTENQKNMKLVPEISIADTFGENSAGLTPRKPASAVDSAIPASISKRAGILDDSVKTVSAEDFENRGVKLS